MKRIAKPKFKYGDMVYTYQNPNIKRRISHVRRSEGYGSHAYKVALKDNQGYSYSSKWIDEGGITMKRTKAWKKENNFVRSKIN